MPTEVIATQLRLLGESQYVSGMNRATGAARGFDTTTQNLERRAKSSSKFWTGLGAGALAFGKRSAAGFGIAAAAAGVVGVKYNALIEDAETANSVLLGSEKAGKQLTRQLVLLDEAIPTLGLPDLLQGSRYLVNAGFNAERTTKTMGKLGDAVSVLGNKQDELNRITYALGQIGSGTVVQTDEFRQLADTGVTSFKRMGRQFGMSGADFKKALADQKVSTEDFFAAFDRDLLRFEGGARLAKGTFSGQVATMGADWNRIMGRLTKPAFEGMKQFVFPQIEKGFRGVERFLDSGKLEQWLSDFKVGRKDLVLPGEKPTPMMQLGLIFGDLTTSATDLGKALDGPLGKLGSETLRTNLDALVGLVDLLRGAIDLLAKALGKANSGIDTFYTNVDRAVDAYNKLQNSPLGRVVPGPALPTGRQPGKKRKAPTVEKLLKDAYQRTRKNLLPFQVKDLLSMLGGRAAGGPVIAGHGYVVGEKGPEIFTPKLSGTIIPNQLAMPALQLPSGEAQIVVPVSIDGKVITRVVAKHSSDARARKGPSNMRRPWTG